MIRVLALLALILAASPAFAFDALKEAGIDQRPGAHLPLDVPFQDETGAAVTLRALLDGKPMLLAPVVHDCPNICGVTLAGLVAAAGRQDLAAGRDFSIVAFGIDPKERPRDAAASLGKLRNAYTIPADALHGLTGTADHIAAVTKALGYRYGWDQELGQYAHMAAVAVISPDGRLSRWLYGVSPEPSDLKLALVDAGRGKVGSWSDQLLLLCYHYDPATGRYGPLIWTLLRIGSAATFVILGGLIGLALLRDRRRRAEASHE
jgi:protein SCO1/2